MLVILRSQVRVADVALLKVVGTTVSTLSLPLFALASFISTPGGLQHVPNYPGLWSGVHGLWSRSTTINSL